MVNHFSKPKNFRNMNFLKLSITEESWRLSVSYTFMNDSSVIDHFWKFISQKLLSFEKWFTTHFLPHGHRKKMSAFLIPFSTLLVNIFHAEHLGRFFKEHPLYVIPIIINNIYSYLIVLTHLCALWHTQIFILWYLQTMS